MLQVGFGKTFQNLPYFDQSVAYVVRCAPLLRGEGSIEETKGDVVSQMEGIWFTG